MSWLSDLGSTLGSMGGVLGAFVPGVGQAIAGVGGLLALTDDPEALILFPGYPFEPGGMAYGIQRAKPGDGGSGIYLGGISYTNGPSYEAEAGPNSYWHEWSPFINSGAGHAGRGIPQPMQWQETPLGGSASLRPEPRGWFRIDRSYWGFGDGAGSGFQINAPGQQFDATRSWREEGALLYAAKWGLDLETITRAPIGMGNRRLFIQDEGGTRMGVFEVPEFGARIQRGPLADIVLAERGQEAAVFWKDEWLTASSPVFDSSVANLQTWDEPGGGAIQTWMQTAPLWDRDDSGSNVAYRGYPSLESWRNLETVESVQAFQAWETYQGIEQVKYQNAAAPWYEQKQQIEAQQAWDEYQAQAEAFYWAQWQESQSASAEYLEGLAAVSESPTPEDQIPEQTALGISVNPPQMAENAMPAGEAAALDAELSPEEEEAIGIGATAAALIILL